MVKISLTSSTSLARWRMVSLANQACMQQSVPMKAPKAFSVRGIISAERVRLDQQAKTVRRAVLDVEHGGRI